MSAADPWGLFIFLSPQGSPEVGGSFHGMCVEEVLQAAELVQQTETQKSLLDFGRSFQPVSLEELAGEFGLTQSVVGNYGDEVVEWMTDAGIAKIDDPGDKPGTVFAPGEQKVIRRQVGVQEDVGQRRFNELLEPRTDPATPRLLGAVVSLCAFKPSLQKRFPIGIEALRGRVIMQAPQQRADFSDETAAHAQG